MSELAVEAHGLRKVFGTVLALDGLSLAVPGWPSRFALWDSVRDLTRSGTTVLLTAQYLEEADALADRVMIISAAFVPATAMPGWLPAFGIHQPVDALVNAERALILGGPAAPDVLISPAWSGGLLVVFALLAARTYARLGR